MLLFNPIGFLESWSFLSYRKTYKNFKFCDVCPSVRNEKLIPKLASTVKVAKFITFAVTFAMV